MIRVLPFPLLLALGFVAPWASGCFVAADWGSKTENRPCGANDECLPGYACQAGVCVAVASAADASARDAAIATDGAVGLDGGEPGEDAAIERPDAEEILGDAGKPPRDAGGPGDDASAPGDDAGTPPDAAAPPGPDAGTCDPAYCPGICIGPTCEAPTCLDPRNGSLIAKGAVCRPAAGDCDSAETCDGLTPACPADARLGSSTVCRSTAGTCDLPDSCDGTNVDCPADEKVAADTVCHGSLGDCDPAEKCDGTSSQCPTDQVYPDTFVCRAATSGGCDLAERCDGFATSCPADGYEPGGTTCRGVQGLCDVAETCPGGTPDCPGDQFLDVSNVCRQPGPSCGMAQTCPGNAAGCPAVQTSGAPPVPGVLAANVPAAAPMTVQLSWSAVSDPEGDAVGYLVEVSNVSDFSAVIATSGPIAGTLWTTPALNGFSTYYWRVKATDTAHAPCDQGWSGTSSFTTPPIAPELNAQGNITLGCGTPLPWGVTLSWIPVSSPHPVEYHFQLTGSYDAVVMNWAAPMYDGAWQAGTTFDVSLIGYDAYYWRVATRDTVTGQVSAWSSVGIFGFGDDCSSCPLIYAWDGARFRYVTDIAGWNISFPSTVDPTIVQQYQPQYFVLDGLALDGGEYHLKIREVLAETSYLDLARLAYVDHPAGTEIASSSAEHVLDVSPVDKPFKIHTMAAPVPPVSAVNQEGLDVLASLLAVDNVPALARKDTYESYTLDFGAVGDLANARLVIDGWKANNIKTSVSSSARPSVEVLDGAGQWVKVVEFGPPKGDLKTMVVDLAGRFLTAQAKVRVNLGLFPRPRWAIDRIRLDTSAPIPVDVVEVPATWADLHHRGNSTHSETDLTTRILSVDDVLPDLPGAYSFGAFTRYGDVVGLVDAVDDLHAIMRHGDEAELRYPAPPPPARGMTRTFLLKTGTYYKGFKYRAEDRWVEPLPYAAMPRYPYSAPDAYPTDQAHQDYRSLYNTRVEVP